MKKPLTIHYSLVSVEDLEDIRAYIANELSEPRVALRQITRIRESIHTLRTMPRRHRVVDWEPWHTQEIRSLTIDNYVAFYRVTNDSVVEVVRILYGGRDVRELARI